MTPRGKILIILIFISMISLTIASGNILTMKHSSVGSEGEQIVIEREWNRTYGGERADFGYDLIETMDGGLAFTGETKSWGASSYDAWLVKTDVNGVILWSKTYRERNSGSAYSLLQTPDSGFALAGTTSSYGNGSSDMWLIKTNVSGIMEWNQTYGGIRDDWAISHVLTTDNGFALAGSTNSYGGGETDMFIVKTDADGAIEWNQTYGGTGMEWAYSVIQTDEGGFALAGHNGSWITNETHNFLETDMWLVKTDNNGTEQWNQTYDRADDECYTLIQTMDGGFALVGKTDSYGNGSSDMWVIKTDINGVEEWNLTYGGTGYESAQSVVQTPDEGFALAGMTHSYGSGSSDIWVIKTDVNGIVEWNQTCGGTGREVVSSFIQVADNGFVIAGHTNSWGAGSDDAWLVKISLLPQNISTNGTTSSLFQNSSNNMLFGLILLLVIISLLAIVLLYQKLN